VALRLPRHLPTLVQPADDRLFRVELSKQHPRRRHRNLGDIWTSTDAGATWTSARVAGTLPVPLNGEVGRMNLAAVPGTSGSSTAVVYALAGNQTGSATVAVMKSVDGGATWNVVAQGKNTVPTNPAQGATGSDCLTMDIGHGQSSTTWRSRSTRATRTTS